MSGAAMAAEMFVAGVKQAVAERTIDPNDSSAWVALLRVVDQEIERHPLAGETTGIVIAVTPTSVVGASVGDSRAWLFTDRACELTGSQARKPRLGTGRAVPTPFTEPAGGVLVAGTDGLFDYAAMDDIRAIALTVSDDTANALAQLPRARTRRLPDDVAVVVGWLDEPGSPS